MKTLIIPLAIATTLAAGAASAQPYGYGYGSARSIDARQAMIAERIDRNEADGDLTRGEAYRLKSEFNAIANLEARYRWNGFSRWELSDLNRRLDGLQNSVRLASRDNDRRYGYNDERDYRWDYPRY
ncbi:MAG: hypothetical protein JNL41_05795 [Phenylobacterium sp.]|uniref:hypothetical protein n=1 Tax=Phenylobacterium sp. TaxID=1871053 RepID=UPI001A644F14|nr:hypothetical protein [Phenylobacterium sp.]MBL8553771.1 hypothetical protein [Phenylobacterium sp.]